MTKKRSRKQERGQARSSARQEPARKQPARKETDRYEPPPIETRDSGIHGCGVYATRSIKKGTRIIEYLGERITHAEADRRYEIKGDDDGHTFLFVVNDEVCIDAGVGGNAARFINHTCNPNCETVIENDRVFIDAVRTIQPGDELGYDYQLTWESTDDPEELKLYACRCGATNCRGTMLDRIPLDEKRKAEAAARRRKTAQRRKRLARKKPSPARGGASKATRARRR